MRSDIPLELLRTGSRDHVSTKRRYRYKSDALDDAHACLSLSDFDGDWSEAITDTPDWCFCDKDTRIRKGPNNRPGGKSSTLGKLFTREGGGAWVVQKTSAFENEDDAAKELAWAPNDCALCARFDGGLFFGPYGVRGTGEWRLATTAADHVGAALRFESDDGRELHGEKWFVQHDRFVVAIESFAVATDAYADIGRLLDGMRTRLAATAAEYPRLPPRPA